MCRQPSCMDRARARSARTPEHPAARRALRFRSTSSTRRCGRAVLCARCAHTFPAQRADGGTGPAPTLRTRTSTRCAPGRPRCALHPCKRAQSPHAAHAEAAESWRPRLGVPNAGPQHLHRVQRGGGGRVQHRHVPEDALSRRDRDAAVRVPVRGRRHALQCAHRAAHQREPEGAPRGLQRAWGVGARPTVSPPVSRTGPAPGARAL